MAVAVADQPRQPTTGDAAHPRAELVEDDERDRREQEHPEQAIAEVGAEDRVRRDPGRVVVREAGEYSRPDDSGKSDHPRVPPGGQSQRVPDRASASDGAHGASLRFASRWRCACEYDRLCTLLETVVRLRVVLDQAAPCSPLA